MILIKVFHFLSVFSGISSRNTNSRSAGSFSTKASFCYTSYLFRMNSLSTNDLLFSYASFFCQYLLPFVSYLSHLFPCGPFLSRYTSFVSFLVSFCFLFLSFSRFIPPFLFFIHSFSFRVSILSCYMSLLFPYEFLTNSFSFNFLQFSFCLFYGRFVFPRTLSFFSLLQHFCRKR